MGSSVSDSGALNRYNRMRSITFDAELATGYSLGEAVEYMEQLIREKEGAEGAEEKASSLHHRITERPWSAKEHPQAAAW